MVACLQIVKAKGVVLASLRQVNAGRRPAFTQRCFLSVVDRTPEKKSEIC